MVTDLAEILRLGTAKEKENLDFRRYLSARHHADDQFPIVAGEVQRHVDCTGCANCCRHSVVPVSKAEIETIAQNLGSDSETVTHRYTVPDPDAPALRILLNQRDRCVFLDGNLCTVYAARPETCRNFPHVAAGSHTLGSRLSSHARWAALCPIIYNALEQYKHLTGYHPHSTSAPRREVK